MTSAQMPAAEPISTAGRDAPTSDVFSVICHDLRDPLSAIVMGVQLLLGTAQDDRSKRVLEAIARAGERMSVLIQNAATLRGQPLKLRVMQYPVEEVLGAACTKLEKLAARKSVVVERRVSVDGTVIPCDASRLVEALVLVGENAIRHAEGHPVVVGAKLDRDVLSLWVTDRGGGIAKERLATIFDWASNASQPSREGAGLGLAAAKRIVEAHGGTIELESRLGHGTTCSIVIPLAAPLPAATERTTEDRSCSTS
jgi:signal transduction histidine kinase